MSKKSKTAEAKCKISKKTKRPRTKCNVLGAALAVIQQQRHESLYGFYCAGYTRGAQQTTVASAVAMPSERSSPQELWAFAFGFRGGRDKHDLLGLSVLLLKCDEYFTRPATRTL